MRIFNLVNQEVLNSLGLFTKKQVLIIAVISTIAPAIMYFYGAFAFVIPKESMTYMDNYFWIVISYILCVLLLLNHYIDYINFIMEAYNNKEKNESYNELICKIKSEKDKDESWRFRFILLLSIMPLYSIFSIITLKKDIVPGSSLILMSAYSITLPFLLKLDFIKILDIVSSKKLNFNFKYSDKYAGIKPLSKLLNSSFCLSIAWVCFGVFLAYTFIKSSEPYTTLLYMVYGFSAFFFGFMGLVFLFYSSIEYDLLSRNFKNAKKAYLQELEKENSFESLYLYYKVSQKRLMSAFDNLFQPIKILIIPTIMTFARSKIITIEDLNTVYNWIFS